MRVLVLEASTSAAKALVYDDEKGVVGTASEEYGPAIDAGGVHDARAVYELVVRLGRNVAEGNDIAAIGLSGVWHSILALDTNLKPAGKAYLWNFTGTNRICREIRDQKEKALAIYRNTGCMPNITYQPYSLLYMKKNGLDLADKLFCSQAGYNFLQLTGERLETKNIVSGMGLLNTHELRYDDGILELCGIRPEQLGALVDYRSHRPLTAEGAAALGVAPGIPVVPPHSDGGLNQIGNGAMRAGRMTFSVGTSAAIRLTTDHPVLSDPPATWCYVGADGWMSGAATNGACNCVNWFVRTLLRDKWSFDELGVRLLDEGPAPVFLPFNFGERCPGWEDTRRGGFQDLAGSDSPEVLFRAVSEGVLFNIYQCYRILTPLSGVPDRIILSGGILNSPKWAQMAADIFQREMHLSDNPNASVLGGAALALHAAGGLDDLHGFGDIALESVAPRPGAAAAYQKKFNRYLECYEAMKGTP
ncbi:MAG: hypothetical protein LBS30_05310 [Planctomycetota bacterium]|nr:hypothetical protein [Planctomycetota bacterium]